MHELFLPKTNWFPLTKHWISTWPSSGIFSTSSSFQTQSTLTFPDRVHWSLVVRGFTAIASTILDWGNFHILAHRHSPTPTTKQNPEPDVDFNWHSFASCLSRWCRATAVHNRRDSLYYIFTIIISSTHFFLKKLIYMQTKCI